MELYRRGKRQSINHNEILGDNDDTRFFTEVHLLASKLVPIVAIHPLRGSRTNRHHTPNPQPGATQPTQDGDPQATSNPLKIPFVISHTRKAQEPLTITMIGARDKHHPPLNDPRYTKPSRLRQPPRVTSESHNETQLPSASRCNHSKQCTWMLSNLTK